MNLLDFLQLPRSFEWGGLNGDDCTTFCASWVLDQMGVDPAAEFRGTYCSPVEAYRIIRAYGGIASLFDHQVAPYGIKRVQDPADGDIGIIQSPWPVDGKAALIGAIRFGPLWASLSPGRVVTTPADFTVAWRLPC
ncbi:hypothetical protein EQW76_00900 [Rhizobium sp. rho-13.1]|uniref:DUF6950 family protein n=1 Tax=Rhizobium sp. rho-13.1 TaxID=2506431 RepID=UPI00115F310F|nr:hypothetical protein [Rhizobium sp. rho-13.1]TQX91325.1 hypothetical protein EQW76_00900 [Rhizobium sp. rho-13.1]